MTLYEAWGKNVTIRLKDGQTFSGKAVYYTQALDNEPEIASICVGDYELYENEIESITLNE